MTEAFEKGNFYVAELPDGRFVAASNCSPYFCFRADSEEAVLAKVSEALAFFFGKQRVQRPMPRPTTTVHNWTNKRTLALRDYAPIAA